MAQLSSASKKRHDIRKNPASKEFFAKQRKAQNAARPKQHWVESAIETGKDSSPTEGYWSRD